MLANWNLLFILIVVLVIVASSYHMPLNDIVGIVSIVIVCAYIVRKEVKHNIMQPHKFNHTDSSLSNLSGIENFRLGSLSGNLNDQQTLDATRQALSENRFTQNTVVDHVPKTGPNQDYYEYRTGSDYLDHLLYGRDLRGDDRITGKMMHMSRKSKNSQDIRTGFNRLAFEHFYQDELNDHANKVWWDNDSLELYM